MFRIIWYIDEELLRAYLEYLSVSASLQNAPESEDVVCPACSAGFSQDYPLQGDTPISKCLWRVYTHVRADVLFQLHYLHLT